MGTTELILAIAMILCVFILETEALFLLLRQLRNATALVMPADTEFETAAPRPVQLQIGDRVPAFSAVAYRTQKHIDTVTLAGQEWIVAFFSASDVSELETAALRGTIGGLWSKTDGLLIVVLMSDSPDDCAIFHERAGMTPQDDEQVALVPDVGGHITHSFTVERSPCALIVDANQRIRKVGQMS